MKEKEKKTIIRKRENRESDNKKINQSTVKYSNAEKEIFLKKANELNLGVCAAIRKLALNNKLTIIAKSDIETSIQLKKIGTNINQVVKKINALDVKKDENELKKEIKNISDFINEIRNVLSKLSFNDC